MDGVMYKLGWFSTGRDKAARDLLRAVQYNIKHNGIKAEIQFVFSNRDPTSDPETEKFFHLANAIYKLPYSYFPWRVFYKAYWREHAPSEQIPLFQGTGTTVQAPYPTLVQGGSYHRRFAYQRQRRKAAPLYQMPLVPYGYQIPLLPAEAPPLRHDPFEQWRLEYDKKVIDAIENQMGFHPDLCVLAGYMLIVSPEMCQRYNMINLHPAAPGGPTGTWQEVIWQLIDNKAKETGVMMHLVTPELDKGPPVAYCTFPIRGEPFDRYWRKLEKLPSNSSKRHDEKNSLFRLIRQHGLAREFPLIISTLKTFGQGKIKITADKKLFDSEGKPINGYNLTDEINELVKGEIPQ